MITYQGQAEKRRAMEGRKASRAHIAKAAIIAICTGLIVWLTMHAASKALPQAAYDAAHHECQAGKRCA